MSEFVELRKIAENARQASVRPALWEPYRLYNALADGIEELLDRVEKAERALQRVRELHYSFDHRGYGLCAECTVEEYPTDWPCPTIKAIDSPQ